MLAGGRRLNTMTEPLLQVRERGTHVLRPFGVGILLGEPRHRLIELVGGRRQRDAVGQIGPPIAKGKELDLQVAPTERAQDERAASATRAPTRR
jgi:hypothetical protein